MEFLINNYKWEIKEVEGPVIDKVMGDNNHLACCCMNYNNIIYIKLGEYSNKKIHLIHELTHAFLISNVYRDEKFTDEQVCLLFQTYAEQVIYLANKFLEEG